MHLETHLPLLLDLLLKSTVVLALAGVVYRLCRRASAANRHVIAVATLGTLLLLPLTKLARPRWAYELKHDAPAAPLAIKLPPITMKTSSETGRASAPVLPANAPAQVAITSVNWSAVSVAVWLAGFALVLLHRAGVGLRLRRLAAESRVINGGRVLAMARGLAAVCGVRAEIRESDTCRVPLAFGVWRPTVLLPTEAMGWSDERLSAALRHELGHIHRRDCLTRFFADMACAFYWMNPLVWLGARTLRLAQEQSCDDLVLRSGARAERYASQLVDVVRSVQQDRFSARHALAMAQQSTLETRVRAIVDETRDRSPQSRRAAAAGSLLVVSALAICLAAQVRGADRDTTALALGRGLAFLAAHQNEDGSLGAGRYRGSVGVTSLAGLALMADDAHAGRVKQAAKFILSCQKDNGFIDAAAGRTGMMYDHGFATLFLAEYSKATSQPDVREKLAKAADLIVKSQGKEGGWRYKPTPEDGDVSATSCQLMALVAARSAGVNVPAETIDRGVNYLKRCQNPDGGFKYVLPRGNSAFPRSAAALAASLASMKWAGTASQPDAEKGANYLMGFLPQAGASPEKMRFFIHGQYYAGQALQIVGGETWKRWHEAVRDDLLASQQADGSWADGVSVELATSEACLILQSRKAGR